MYLVLPKNNLTSYPKWPSLPSYIPFSMTNLYMSITSSPWHRQIDSSSFHRIAFSISLSQDEFLSILKYKTLKITYDQKHTYSQQLRKNWTTEKELCVILTVRWQDSYGLQKKIPCFLQNRSIPIAKDELITCLILTHCPMPGRRLALKG